ncbi:MAG: phosphatase PAP2 family protein [Ignavibacteriaceae bacterium]
MITSNRNTFFNNRSYGFIIVYIILLILAAFYDLQLSQSIVNPDSGWAVVIEDYGELPGIITLLTAIFIYHKKKKHSSNARTILYSVILTYSAFMLFNYASFLLFKPFITSLYPVLAFAAFLTIISVVLVKELKVDFSEKAFRFAKTVLLMGLFGYMFFVQPLKIFWGRVRYRDLEALHSNFTPWFSPNGITGSQSFPSGHSAMGFLLISFYILFRNNSLPSKYFLYIFILLWAITVAAGRVVTGAHFLSDVVVGSAGMVFCYLYFSNKDRLRNV